MTILMQATIEVLQQVPDHAKAEIVNGELVLMAPAGGGSGFAGDAIFVSLWQYAQRANRGVAVGDNKGFHVDLPNRSSFSPDAALYIGPDPGMRYYEGAPVFAVEVRSENDYGPVAETAMSDKRADYFAAGTLVVWDVDLLSAEVIKVYRAHAPHNPDIFRRGQVADAEPAAPGWTFLVDDLFR